MGDIPLMVAPQENVFWDMGGIVKRMAD